MEQARQKEILNKFKPFLWSYDVAKLDLKQDRERIITNVLNYGTTEATDLLREIYDACDIRAVLQNPKHVEWSAKSLNYWSIIYDIEPVNINNVFRHIG